MSRYRYAIRLYVRCNYITLPTIENIKYIYMLRYFIGDKYINFGTYLQITFRDLRCVRDAQLYNIIYVYKLLCEP